MIIILPNLLVHEHFALVKEAKHRVKVTTSLQYLSLIYKLENPKTSLIPLTILFIHISGDSGSGYFVKNGNSFQIAGLVSAAVIQECGTNDFVLFTDVAKYSDWVRNEVSVTQNTNSFDSVFNSFDEDGGDAQSFSSNIVNAQCTFRNAG